MLEISLYGVRKMVLDMAKAKRRASSFFDIGPTISVCLCALGPFSFGLGSGYGVYCACAPSGEPAAVISDSASRFIESMTVRPTCCFLSKPISEKNLSLS